MKIHIRRPWKLSNFQDPPPRLSSYVQNSSNPSTLDVQFQTNSPPLQMITSQLHQLKWNIILGWLLYVIRSFLQVGFPFQYQLINILWLSIAFISFSWIKSCPQSNFKKLKTSFLSFLYSEKMRWLSWSLNIYFFVSAVVQKYHEMFSQCSFCDQPALLA